MKRKRLAAIFFAAAIGFGLAASAGAVDGTIEINQATVLASGGFPYTTAASGSYRLTGNLTVSGSGTNAINVGANHVTIDLNGFTITGGGTTGGGTGISASGVAVTIENGTIVNFQNGVFTGFNSTIRSIHADQNKEGITTSGASVIEDCTANSNSDVGITTSNDGSRIQGCTANSNFDGINAGADSVVEGSTANDNTDTGIIAGLNSRVQGCTANANMSAGIIVRDNGVVEGSTANGTPSGNGILCFATGCAISGNTANNNQIGVNDLSGSSLILHNTLSNNSNKGIRSFPSSNTGYGENVLSGNGQNVSGGTSMGNNVCNGVVC